MKRNLEKFHTTFLCLITLSCILISQLSQAQMYRLSDERAGKWETSLMWKFQDSETIDYNNGNTLALASTDRWGFTLGYNLSNHINIHWAFSYLKPSYKASIPHSNIPQEILDANPDLPNPFSFDHKGSMTSNHVNFAYNILKGKFTPYVSAGLGFSNIDSNLKSGSNSCYWDYYYGWVCYSNTYNDTSFSYTVGAGFRWDIDRDIFVRAGVNQEYLDISRTKGTPTFTTGQFEIGFRL